MLPRRIIKKQKGFTLIEVLIYSALLALFIGAVLAFISSILGTTDTLLEKNEVMANRELVERKLNWIFSGASSVLEPVVASSSLRLKLNGSSTAVYPATVELSDGKLTLAIDGEAPIPITNNRVRVTQFTAEHYSSAQAASTVKLTFIVQSAIFNYIQSTSTLIYVVKR
jgi:type II secretory pathway pseudopilin PulG